MQLHNLDQVEVTKFVEEVVAAFEQKREYVRPTLAGTGIRSGRTVQWTLATSITAEPQPKAPAADIPTTETHFTPKSITIEPRYLGIYEDKFDQVLVNFNVRAQLIEQMAASKARYIDKVAVSVLDQTTHELDSSAAYVSLDDVQKVATYLRETLQDAAPRIYWAVSPGVWAKLMELPQFANADWQGQVVWGAERPRFRYWQGIYVYEVPAGLPKTGSTVSTFVYADRAVGFHSVYDEGKGLGSMQDFGGGISVDWIPQKASWLISYAVACGGLLLRPEAVVRVKLKDDLAASIV